MQSDIETKIAQLVEKEPAYTADAYHFVSKAVTFTVSRLQKHRHVSALELLKGTGELAVQEYGAVARQVLNEYGLCRASDVGKVVYLLIGAGILSASDDDDPEDFNVEFEFLPASAEEFDPAQPLCTVPIID